MDKLVEMRVIMHQPTESWRHQSVLTEPRLGAGLTRRHWTQIGSRFKTKNGDWYVVKDASIHDINDLPDIPNLPTWAPTFRQEGFEKYILYEVQRLDSHNLPVGDIKEIKVYFKPFRPKKKSDIRSDFGPLPEGGQ